MDEQELQEIREKIEALTPNYRDLGSKLAHVQDIRRGLENLLGNSPKNIDCTEMTPSQIATAKANLFEFADAFIDE